MLKTINFHVGSGRCGSTLIQALFNDKMFHEIFAQHSIKYDPHIYRDTGMIAHDETFIREHWQPVKDQYFTPMESLAEQSFFVTQENLLGMRSEKGQKNICDVSCEKIAFLAEGYHPKIIILVRRQDTYIESLYNQCIKRYETRDFQTFCDDFPRENWHWADNIETYAKFFGRENVTVIPFEQKVYAESEHSGFLAAVIMAIGVETRLAFRDLPVINPSLAPRAVEVMRVANKHLSKREAHNLADWFEAHVQKDPNDRYRLMNDELRSEIVAYFKESNARLCDEYFTGFPAAKAYYTGADL
ncbi:hypothetical protein L2D14_14740 [Thalassospiraceae bacterium LMO-JJ14]|nr:hypothetical protein L2D14_14740 [Thalassospiraceae bacterium LMO-JJ14]